MIVLTDIENANQKNLSLDYFFMFQQQSSDNFLTYLDLTSPKTQMLTLPYGTQPNPNPFIPTQPNLTSIIIYIVFSNCRFPIKMRNKWSLVFLLVSVAFSQAQGENNLLQFQLQFITMTTATKI